MHSKECGVIQMLKKLGCLGTVFPSDTALKRKSKDELIDMLHKVLEQEQKSKLQPFPFIENDGYLLLLKNGLCITARWSCGHFNDDTTETCIEEEIESIVALKDLGL